MDNTNGTGVAPSTPEEAQKNLDSQTKDSTPTKENPVEKPETSEDAVEETAE